MKKVILSSAFAFILGVAIAYFFLSKDSGQSKAIFSMDSRDSIPLSVMKDIKKKFVALSDTATFLPIFDSSKNLAMAAFYTDQIDRDPEPVPREEADPEIAGYSTIMGSSPARSVWVDIKDIMSLVGPQGVNRGYDGFRFYLAKAMHAKDPQDNGHTSLVMVATRPVNGYHEDVLAGDPNFVAIFNKFDPCPPPAGGCGGTKLFRH
jgi:hypothetical protein